ncbi:50S ribosomal protein L5 [bacterium AB1]|nr:50S ribosomal protein L5 [bacterium AB1]
MNNKKNFFKNIDDVDLDNISNSLVSYKPHFQERYEDEIIDNIKKKFDIKNIHNVPKIKKIVISASISNTNVNHTVDLLKKIYNSLYLMSGVKPIYTKAKQSISQFKIYKGVITGAKVVLNKHFAYEFLEKLCHAYLPNLKGFKGIPIQSISGNTLNIGINDAHIVNEIVNYLGLLNFSFNITIVVDRSFDKEVIAYMLKSFDLPIRDDLR